MFFEACASEVEAFTAHIISTKFIHLFMWFADGESFIAQNTKSKQKTMEKHKSQSANYKKLWGLAKQNTEDGIKAIRLSSSRRALKGIMICFLEIQ